MRVSSDDFPLLKGYSLYAADIRGDGNCLFNALSDQIYGNQDEHSTIRARVIQYMREHADYYKQFVDVHPGGGHRRNPKRKNAGVYATRTQFSPPTPEQIDVVFESHLSSMARGGTYGDNMEIQAFASAYGVDVKIYQQDFAYMIPAPTPEPGTHRRVAHIAYHMWEHYSSIRNIDGPHMGLPEIKEVALSPEEEARNKAAAARISAVAPWQIKVVMGSLPYLADRETIKRTLEEHHGNVDLAVSALLDAEDRASVSSQNGSSSTTERDADSEDELGLVPTKKQTTRLGRAVAITKHVQSPRQGTRVDPGVQVIRPKSSPAKILNAETRLAVSRVKALRPSRRTKDEGSDEGDDWTSNADSDGDFKPDTDFADEDELDSDNSMHLRFRPVRSEFQTIRPDTKITFGSSNIVMPAKQTVPAVVRIRARDKKEHRKLAQKAARRERTLASKWNTQQLQPTSVNVKMFKPLEISMGIKTLYI